MHRPKTQTLRVRPLRPLPLKGALRLKKEYGQHLLVSKGVIKAIVDYALLSPDDVVVEIGAGTGNLTREILTRPIKRLYVIEIDPQMIRELKNIEDERLTVIEGDATEFEFCSLGDTLKLLGNLPYNVASLIVENTILHKDCIPFALYMVQKEVAEKLIKGPSWLSAFVRTFYRLRYLMSIPPKFFIPPPKVNSALVEFKRREDSPKLEDLRDYKSFLTKLFSMRRKALKNKISEELLQEAGLNPMLRVEELSLEEVIHLYSLSKRTP